MELPPRLAQVFAFLPLLPLLLLGSLAPTRASTEPSTEPVVARVGDRTVTLRDFEERAAVLLRTGYRHLDTLDMGARLQLLEGVIAQELLVLEGLRRGVAQDSAIAYDLERTERKALIGALYEHQALHGDYTSTDDELRTYFVAGRFDTEVLSRHIVVDTAEEGRAVVRRLQEGASFEQMVAEHSRPSIRSRFGPGGWVGWFRIGDLYEELRDLMESMHEEQLCPEPVRTALGYHVFWLKQRRAVDYASSREFLRERLRVQKRADDMAAYVSGLRSRYDLRLHEAAVRSLADLDPVRMRGETAVQLASWLGGSLSAADYAALLAVGRVRPPSELGFDALRKEVDNQAGVEIMVAEARRLGLVGDPEVRGKVEARRRELLATWLFQQEGLEGARPDTSSANVHRFYDENLDLYTRADGTVTAFERVAGSIRGALIDDARTEAMDRFLATLRQTWADRIHVDAQALQRALLRRPPSTPE